MRLDATAAMSNDKPLYISFAGSPKAEMLRPEEGIDRVKRGQGRRGGPAYSIFLPSLPSASLRSFVVFIPRSYSSVRSLRSLTSGPSSFKTILYFFLLFASVLSARAHGFIFQCGFGSSQVFVVMLVPRIPPHRFPHPSPHPF